MMDLSEAGLLAANRAFFAAFESLDLDRMSAQWARTVTVTCVHPGWDLVVGARDVMETWREIFAGTSSVRFETEAAHATLIERAGWVVCRAILHTNIQGQPVENVMTSVNTFVWEDDAFRICHHHAAPRIAGRPQPKPGKPQILH